MKQPSRFAREFFALLVRPYPASFRAEFGEEMKAVFACAVADTAAQGRWVLVRLCLRELADWPGALLHEWRSSRQADRLARKGATMEIDSDVLAPANDGTEAHVTSGPPPWREALAAAALFLGAGLALALEELPSVHPWWPWLIFGSYLLVCVGAGIGWVEGFPRWSYAYVGYGLLFVLYMTSVSTPGLRVLGHTFARGEHWGWRAWLPMAVVLLLGLAATRSLRPAVQLVTGAWRDPTRLSFLLYGATPLVLWMLFDEVHKPFPAPFLAVSGLCLAAGAVAYIRGRTQVQHALALLAGLAAAWLVTTVGVSAYWHGRVVGKATEPLRWSSNAVPMTIALVVVALLMLAPALVLALVRLGARPKRTA